LKAIHNELPAAAHGEGRNANCPRPTFVAGAGQPGYWIPVTLEGFSQPVWQEIQYLPQVGPGQCIWHFTQIERGSLRRPEFA
jgi:hypothetical protein